MHRLKNYWLTLGEKEALTYKAGHTISNNIGFIYLSSSGFLFKKGIVHKKKGI